MRAILSPGVFANLDRTMLLVALGTYAGAAMAFVANLMVSRGLGPEGLGLFAVFMTVGPVLYELSGHGLDAAMVRFAAPLASRDPKRAAQIQQAVLLLKIGINLALVTIGYAALAPLLMLIFGHTAHLHPMQHALFFGLALSLWRWVMAVYQSRQSYRGYLVTLLANNTIKLALLIPVLLFLNPGSHPIMLIFTASALGACGAGGWGLWRSMLRRHLTRRIFTEISGQILRVGGWVILSTLVFMLVEPLNVFMIEAFADRTAVGFFAAALILAKTVDHLVLSIKTVLLPRVSGVHMAGYGAYIRQSLTLTIPLAVAILPLYGVSDWLIRLLFSTAFEGAIPIFKVLFWGYWLSLILDPLWLLFYARGKTRFLLYADLLMLGFMAGLNLYTIPRFGAVGAAYSLVLGRLLGRCLLAWLLRVSLAETPEPSPVG